MRSVSLVLTSENATGYTIFVSFANYFTLGTPYTGEKPLCKLPENMPIPNPKEGVALKRKAETEAARIRPRMSHVKKAPEQRSDDDDDNDPPSDEEKNEGAATSSSSESETSDTSLTEFMAKYGAAHDPSSNSRQPPA